MSLRPGPGGRRGSLRQTACRPPPLVTRTGRHFLLYHRLDHGLKDGELSIDRGHVRRSVAATVNLNDTTTEAPRDIQRNQTSRRQVRARRHLGTEQALGLARRAKAIQESKLVICSIRHFQSSANQLAVRPSWADQRPRKRWHLSEFTGIRDLRMSLSYAYNVYYVKKRLRWTWQQVPQPRKTRIQAPLCAGSQLTVERWIERGRIPETAYRLLDIIQNGRLEQLHTDWTGWTIDT